MNKLLIVLLAVCLVNVHAFVKRDAPTTEKNIPEETKKTLTDVSEKKTVEAIDIFKPDEKDFAALEELIQAKKRSNNMRTYNHEMVPPQHNAGLTASAGLPVGPSSATTKELKTQLEELRSKAAKQ